ncbi:MAG: hypothetical protein NUW21_06010, partial [Elusimicrobia bacterium]|nr:hypothetical protein [Elusimicrobiota bacterium]
DGRVRLFYSQPQGAASSATVILSALSSDALGTVFTAEEGVRLSTPAATGALSSPVPVRSTDSFRWRLYYTFYEAFNSTGDVRSALTGAPDPVSANPSTILRSAGPPTVAILGEIFSPGATASITKGAVTIVGTGVTRTDDQHMSAAFATQGQDLGLWDLTVTNADGVPATKANAILIDYAPGTVALTDNLLRPRNGASTLIDIETFNSGRVSVRLYASDGRPIRTLFDDEHAEGSFGFAWDGKDAAGATVPSGLYFVAVNGPKIAVKSKIVVIR